MQAIDLAYRALNDALTILKDEYDKVLQNPSSVEVANTIRGLVGSTV